MSVFNVGKSQIDQSLYTRLAESGVQDVDARELARMDRAGGNNPEMWLKGLRCVAQIATGVKTILDWGQLPQPWNSLGPTINVNGAGPDVAVANAVASLDTEYALALHNAIEVMIATLAEEAATPAVSTSLSAPPTTNQIARTLSVSTLLAPPDPNLVRLIHTTLHGKGDAMTRKKKAGEYMQDWLLEHGRFVQTAYGEPYYLYKAERRLFRMDQTLWQAWLYRLTGINPAAHEFRFLMNDADQLAREGERVTVAKLAHWDAETQMLRVQRFDGTVYRMDGESIEIESNGDGPCLFTSPPYYESYEPDYSAQGKVLQWCTYELPNWDCTPSDRDCFSILFRNWWLATFFSELCPTRPILLVRGEKGSGKTMLIRVMLRFLFGPWIDVNGLPDKADDFDAMLANNHIVAIDNLDESRREFQDKIARAATGSIDKKRKLYTTNDEEDIVKHCWISVTARTPDILQRDDLTDRLIPLPVRRLTENERKRESLFLADVLKRRNQWWGDILLALNAITREIRQHSISDSAGIRMEDWGALGLAMARVVGDESIWDRGQKLVLRGQAEFLLESDVIYQGITAWLTDPSYPKHPLETRSLYGAAKSALYGGDRPDDSWPRSVRSFGRRLVGIRRELAAELASSMNVEMKFWESGTRQYYQFSHVLP